LARSRRPFHGQFACNGAAAVEWGERGWGQSSENAPGYFRGRVNSIFYPHFATHGSLILGKNGVDVLIRSLSNHSVCLKKPSVRRVSSVGSYLRAVSLGQVEEGHVLVEEQDEASDGVGEVVEDEASLQQPVIPSLSVQDERAIGRTRDLKKRVYKWL